MRMTKCGILLLVSIAVFPLGVRAQDVKEVAPTPLQITNAKKVFVSNAGVDSISLVIFRRTGDPDQHYNKFYGAMKKWGRYELVPSPADADLVLELRFVAPLAQCQSIYDSQFRLKILDAKTHFVLWALTEQVQGALRKESWNKDFDTAITALMDDLKKLASQPNGQ